MVKSSKDLPLKGKGDCYSESVLPFYFLRISLINENKSHWHKGALLALTVLNRKQTQSSLPICDVHDMHHSRYCTFSLKRYLACVA